MPRLSKASAATFVTAAALTSVFYINVCHLVFRCGCDFLWAAADAHCNIHNSTGKHCPFCSFGYTGYAGTFGIIIVVQALFSLLPNWTRPVRLGVAIAAFPVTFVLLALVLGTYTGYWD